MQILYEVDSKHQMTSEIAHSLLEACKDGIILYLLQEVKQTSKNLFSFKINKLINKTKSQNIKL